MFHKYSNIIKLNTKTLKYYEAYFFEEIKSFINDNYKFKINIFFFFFFYKQTCSFSEGYFSLKV